jgi:hypothetical protein
VRKNGAKSRCSGTHRCGFFLFAAPHSLRAFDGANKGSAFEATGADGKTLHPNKARFIVALSKTL